MKTKKKKEQIEYVSPVVKVLRVEVEKGYSASRQLFENSFVVSRMYNGGDVEL